VFSRLLQLVCSVLLMFVAVSASAAVAPSSASGAVASSAPVPVAVPPFSAGSLAQVLFGLGLVIALIFALAWFLRRINGGGGFGQPGLKVVATLPLSTRERVVLVQAGEKQLLLGVAPGRINLLQSFDQPIVEPVNAPVSQFANRLKEAVSRREG